jgi:hypothetical protein
VQVPVQDVAPASAAPTQAIDLDALVGADEAAAVAPVADTETTQQAFIGGYTPAPVVVGGMGVFGLMHILLRYSGERSSIHHTLDTQHNALQAEAAPEVVDPRVAWRKKNQDALLGAQCVCVRQFNAHLARYAVSLLGYRLTSTRCHAAKDKAEAAAKKAFADKAAAHLKKVSEQHQKTLSARKEANRSNAKATSVDAGVPAEGTSWEKVTGLVNFNAGAHTKDVTRFKSTLISLKTAKAA